MPPLWLAEHDGRTSVDEVARSEAVRLFVARAQAIAEDFALTPENAAQVAQAGANVLVAGSAVFKGGGADSYRANIAAILDAAALARGEAA